MCTARFAFAEVSIHGCDACSSGHWDPSINRRTRADLVRRPGRRVHCGYRGLHDQAVMGGGPIAEPCAAASSVSKRWSSVPGCASSAVATPSCSIAGPSPATASLRPQTGSGSPAPGAHSSRSRVPAARRPSGCAGRPGPSDGGCGRGTASPGTTRAPGSTAQSWAGPTHRPCPPLAARRPAGAHKLGRAGNGGRRVGEIHRREPAHDRVGREGDAVEGLRIAVDEADVGEARLPGPRRGGRTAARSRSTRTTSPSGPASRAASMATSPAPEPRSSTAYPLPGQPPGTRARSGDRTARPGSADAAAPVAVSTRTPIAPRAVLSDRCKPVTRVPSGSWGLARL